MEPEDPEKNMLLAHAADTYVYELTELVLWCGSGCPGTVNRKEYDEDKPGGGKFYCKVTGRHFESALALKNHTKTKRYKKLKKQLLMGPKPHNQRDAEAAAGMAPPTNS